MKNFRGITHIRKYVSAGMLLLCIITARPAQAQAVYGSIFGTVMDISGVPIRGATITLVSVEKGSKERAISNDGGLFNVDHLVPDTYDVLAEAPHYQACVIPRLELNADRTDLKLQLKKGSGAPVQVSPESALLKTDRADVSTTLSLQELEDLPNFQRNFTAYEALAPGALPNAAQVPGLAAYQNPQQALQVNQNGQHFSGSDFQLDGTENRDPIAGIIVINPPLDSLSEIKFTTQNFDGEFGEALAGLVTAQTRSGSNRWHGDVFEIRNTDWGAASAPYLGNVNGAVNPFKVNLFGGSVGGPLIKNRLFLFGDYQGHRRVFDVTTFAAVPSQKVFNTCLTAGSPVCDLSDYPATIYQPGTPTAFGPDPADGCANNCIPAAMISSQGVNLLKYLPQPNAATGKATQSKVAENTGYQASGVEPWNDDEFDLRLDHSVSERFKIFGRYTLADFRIDANGVFGALAGGPGLSTDLFAGNSRSRDQNISAGFDYIFNPTLNVDFRFGYYRYHLDIFQNGLNTTPAADAGIPGINLGDKFTSGMPAITIADAATDGGVIVMGSAQQQICSNCPLLEHEQEFQWASNWSKTVGRHSIKWGGDFRYAQNLRIIGDRAGSYSFSSDYTSCQSTATITCPKNAGGLALATVLLGEVSSFNRFVGGNYNAEERQNRFFFYGQDTWRMTPRFTLTYSLRWEIYSPQSVNNPGNGGFLDLTTGMIDVAGIGNFNLHGNVKNDFTNLAPRLGLAYQLNPRTVIRAAYGRSFDLGYAGSVFGNTVTQNLPVVAHQQATNSATTAAFSLADGPPAASFPTISGTGQFHLPDMFVGNALTTRVRVPTIDAWNFTVQHQLTPSTFLELGYVANKGTNIFTLPPPSGAQIGGYNVNEATAQGYFLPFPCTPTVCNAAPPGTCASSLDGVCITSTASRQPFHAAPFQWTQQIFYFGNNSNTNYQSLQAKLEKRFKQGIQFRASYTWSKSLAYAQEYYAIDPKLDYGPSDFDRKHAFTFSNLWSLPFGKGKPLLSAATGALDRIVSGWSLNTITFWYSGLPFSPTYNECSQDVDTGPCRPNLVGAVHITGNRSDYFTTTGTQLCPDATKSSPALCQGSVSLSNGVISYMAGPPSGPWQRPAPGTFGNAGYNSLRGPDLLNTDVAVLKNFALKESTTLQFRVDIANVFNRVNLGLPNPCVDCGPATIQNLALNSSMRQFEFALKLQF